MLKIGENGEPEDFVIVTTAGEALSARDAVYIHTDGKAYKCDADDLTKMDFAGFAQDAAALNAAVNIIHTGLASGFSSLTIGARYYVSGTAGAITATLPANVKNVGVAVSATVIRIDKYPTVRRVIFTSTGANTWNKRPGLKHIEVEVQGGGGDGGSSSGFSGAGGSATGGDINITGAAGGDGNGGTGSGALGGNSPLSFQGAGAGGSGHPTKTGYGGGGAGNSGANPGAGGGAGGYARKILPAALLASTETATVGAKNATSTFTVTNGTNVVGSAGSNGGNGSGDDGQQGVIIVTEYY